MKRIFNGSGGRKTALILSLCLIFALAVGTTFALLKANTEPVTKPSSTVCWILVSLVTSREM